MDPIYVTGHQNPDTDSIVAAMAYTALRQALGDRDYQAARLGQVSAETQRVLDRFGFQAPPLLTSVHTQVRDLEFDTPPALPAHVTVDMAWRQLQRHQDLAAIPVVRADGTLYGMLSQEDIAGYHMTQIAHRRLAPVPLENLLSVLEGRLRGPASPNAMIGGDVTIALTREDLPQGRDGVVLCGRQPDLIRQAMELEVGCLVICQGDLPEELADLSTATLVIGTPFDAYRASRLLFQAAPIHRICRTEGLVCFHLDDRIGEVRDQVLRHRAPCYGILDQADRVVGVLSRHHLLRPRRKRVVLVDHNEAAQSVPGLEEAQIVAIVDHHRLADIQTGDPIYVRNEPVGATNTIIAGMFQEHGLLPAPAMAGMMAAAIVSDTVLFKSPTCTPQDRSTAQRLARLAGASLEELGREIFSASTEGLTDQQLLTADYKEFRIAGQGLGVSQVTCVDSAALLRRKDRLLPLMADIGRRQGLDLVLLMLTDVLLEGTWLLCAGDQEIVRQAFGAAPKDGAVFLPRIMSRKKQVIPMRSELWA